MVRSCMRRALEPTGHLNDPIIGRSSTVNNAQVVKARAPYEFGVKASIVTTTSRAPAGQFVLHAAALPGAPDDVKNLSHIWAVAPARRAMRRRPLGSTRCNADDEILSSVQALLPKGTADLMRRILST
jgi:hypothetical protein